MPGSCPTNIPEFTVKLDENEYTLPKEVSTFEMDGKCYLNAMWNQTTSDQHVYIGQPFVQSFSLFINYSVERMAFGLNKQQKYTATITGPSSKVPRGMSGFEKFMISALVIGFVVLVLVAAYFAFQCYKKRNERQQAAAVAYQHV